MRVITQNDIDFILNAGEGLKIELKENLSQLDRAIVAFANAEGGRIFLGINDKKKIIGIELSNVMKSCIQDIARNCDPPANIKLETFKNILIIEVIEGTNKPYKCRDGFFMRIGPNSQKMTRNEIIDLIIKEGRVFFDDCINYECGVNKELNIMAIRQFLNLSHIKTDLSYIDILQNLGAAEKHGNKIYLKNGGVLFFSKHPQKYLRHTDMICVAFKDKEGVEALDRKDLSGNLLEIVFEAERFVERNTRTGFKIKGFSRENMSDYPIEAVREAFINALMHRDYFEKGANVLLKIFPDKIVIDNPGGLVKGMTPKDLGLKSISRNPLIADLFYRAGLAEKIGSGIRRMRDLMHKHGLMPPKIEATEKFFTLTFQGPERKDMIIPDIKGLNKRQMKLVEIVTRNGKINRLAYERLLKIPKRTAIRDLNILVKNGILKSVGKGLRTEYLIK